jgi:ribosomal protein S18 acetylase RimI-like enzyme
MVVRRLVPYDRQGIRRLVEQRGTFNEAEIRVALELVEEALSNPERSEYHFLCAADTQGALTGYICFGPIPMTENCYDLYWIVVDKGCSRQGVGGKLVREMESILRRKRARRVYVDTSSTPAYAAARSFYVKSGYRPVCILDDFYRQGDHKMIFTKEI